MAASGIFGGGFDSLKRWQRRLESAPKVLEVVAKNMAEEAMSLVGQGFQDEEDPYGKAWDALKRRKGRILQDTGRLRSSWHVKRIDTTGFTIAAGVKYARFHQDGTRRMLARRMVPDAGNLPAKWRAQMTEAASEALVAHFGK
jgi:phage gpG-like protein